MKDQTLWQSEPEAHDYPAAASYLSLLFPPAVADAIVAALRKQPLVQYKAKDILRASRLALLDESNAHVQKDIEKARKGRKLSPVLLVRGDGAQGIPLVVADGYHRVCASWWIDEDLDIPCKIADAAAREGHTS
ncbi:MAG: hypothetical protein QM773_06820 [Hyphomonadaceae bacterium]